jgi:hypothetical protein
MTWLDRIKKSSLVRPQYIDLIPKLKNIVELIDRKKIVPREKAKVIN